MTNPMISVTQCIDIINYVSFHSFLGFPPPSIVQQLMEKLTTLNPSLPPSYGQCWTTFNQKSQQKYVIQYNLANNFWTGVFKTNPVLANV